MYVKYVAKGFNIGLYGERQRLVKLLPLLYYINLERHL